MGLKVDNLTLVEHFTFEVQNVYIEDKKHGGKWVSIEINFGTMY